MRLFKNLFLLKVIALQNFAVSLKPQRWISQTFNHTIVLLYGKLYSQDDSTHTPCTKLLYALTILLYRVSLYHSSFEWLQFFQTFSAAHPAWCLKMQYVRWKWKTHVFRTWFQVLLGFKKHRLENQDFKQTILKCRYSIVPEVAVRNR